MSSIAHFHRASSLKCCHKKYRKMFQRIPPTQCEPLIQKIAQTRSLKEEDIPGIIWLLISDVSLFPQLINEESKVLILSPMYGEYLHILTHLIGCNVTHFPLYPDEGFEIDKEGLISISREHDAVILVNPNSPTVKCIVRIWRTSLEVYYPIKTAKLIAKPYG